MTHLLYPKQIPMFWEAIKKCTITANEIDSKDVSSYLTSLLHALLSSNAQCFIRLDENKVLEALAITKLLTNKQKNRQYLYVEALYSWQFREGETWKEDMEFICRFAKQQGCSYVSCQSRNPRAWELYKTLGLTEEFRTFAYYL